MRYLEDELSRAIYASDASNYRIPPRRVVIPESTRELRQIVLDSLNAGVGITLRGRGTSCAGNSIGPGVVIDTSKHCQAILDFNPQERTISVEPGVVLASIQEIGAPHGLRFGPDPSTWTRATIGGSIGNNACGPHAQAWGRVADNVTEMQVMDGFGREFTAKSGAGALEAVAGLSDLVQQNLALIRTECGRFRRQISGYSLEHLLPENGSNLAKFLVGTEGTLVTVLSAKLRLVEQPAAPVLVVLGYPDMVSAAADVPLINTFAPLAVEGMDSRLVHTLQSKPGQGQIPQLPPGQAWLLIEMDGLDLDSALERAKDLAKAVNTQSSAIYPPGTQASRLWRIRADGAGLGGRTPVGEDGSGNDPAWPGWEDAAVPPENLADYLRDFTALMQEMEIDGMLYGHLGDGCLHVRLNLPLGSQAGRGKSREFLEKSADLAVRHRGSLSGEHGDGRARSELLNRMYSPAMLQLFSQLKSLFDPRGLMNPGVIVNPDALDENLRLSTAREIQPVAGGFSFPDDQDFTAAVHRCTGVGKCLAMDHLSGSWMCPTYQATGQEQDATRGRARALQELTNGELIKDFRDPRLWEALDLCLGCKACSSACPTGIDMATYKSEALYRSFGQRPWARPASHFLLGRLPGWLRLAAVVPGGRRLANRVFAVEWIRRLCWKIFALDPQRRMPSFDTYSFRRWASDQDLTRRPGDDPRIPGTAQAALTEPSALPAPTAPSAPPAPTAPTAPPAPTAPSTQAAQPAQSTQSAQSTEQNPWVVLWADSFSEGIDSRGAKATAQVLQQAGYRVFVPEQSCCGLTYITTGQLGAARARLSRLCEVLGPPAVNGIPIVGVEPSCSATLRDDLPRLLPDDPRATAISAAVVSLAQLLTKDRGQGLSWRPPDLRGTKIVAQPHCHHHSILGWEADRQLLESTGAEVIELSGCCGMAGNFGMEAKHQEVSRAVAEQSLLPALREHPQAVYLADGFSCRTQAAQLVGRQGVHLASLLLGQMADYAEKN